MTLVIADEIPELERKADELERQAAAIRQIVAGYRVLNGEADAVLTRRSFESHRTTFDIAPPAADGPRGPEAVMRVMREDADRAWKVVDVKREMLRRGWASTPKAVEASIKRLRNAGKVEGVQYGYYRLVREADADTESPEREGVRPDAQATRAA